MDGRRPVNYFEGPYPLSHNLTTGEKMQWQQLNPQYYKSNKTNSIIWRNDHWASVLKYSNFLHFTVSGKDEKLIEQFSDVMDNLKLKYRAKIRMYFNLTLPRGTYEGASIAERKGESLLGRNHFIILMNILFPTLNILSSNPIPISLTSSFAPTSFHLRTISIL